MATQTSECDCWHVETTGMQTYNNGKLTAAEEEDQAVY
jgi:hypothetical protein